MIIWLPMPSFDPETQTKQCSKCGTRKPVSEFYKRSYPCRDPYAPHCKTCESARAKRRNQEPEVKAHKRNYMRKLRATNPQYRENARTLNRMRRFDPAYRDHEYATAAAWRKTDNGRMRMRAIAARRKALKAGIEGSYTPEDINRLHKAQLGRCAICRKRLPKDFQIDHIQPIALRGSNYPSNLQLTCPRCNQSKKNRDPIDFMRSRGMLL